MFYWEETYRKVCFRYWKFFGVLRRIGKQSYNWIYSECLYRTQFMSYSRSWWQGTYKSRRVLMGLEQGLKTGRSNCVTGCFRDILIQWKDWPGDMIPGKPGKDWDKMIARFPCLLRWFIWGWVIQIWYLYFIENYYKLYRNC